MYCELPGFSLWWETRLQWTKSHKEVNTPECSLGARHCSQCFTYTNPCPPANPLRKALHHFHFTVKTTKARKATFIQLISDRALVWTRSSSPESGTFNHECLCLMNAPTDVLNTFVKHRLYAKNNTCTILSSQQYKALSLFLRDIKVAHQSDRRRICTRSLYLSSYTVSSQWDV